VPAAQSLGKAETATETKPLSHQQLWQQSFWGRWVNPSIEHWPDAAAYAV